MTENDFNNNYSDVNWVLVITTNTEIDGEMYKANLESAEIPVHMLSQVDTTRNFTVGNLAIVKLFVPEEFVDIARQIIDEIDKGIEPEI